MLDSANTVDRLLQLISEEEDIRVKTSQLPDILYKLEVDFHDYMSTHDDTLAALIAVQWFLSRIKCVLSHMLRDKQRAVALDIAAALCCVSDSIAKRSHASGMRISRACWSWTQRQ